MTTPEPDFFRALEVQRTQALVDRDMPEEMRVVVSPGMAAVRYPARLTFPSGKVVDCWHTDIYALRDGAWKATWSQATQLAP